MSDDIKKQLGAVIDSYKEDLCQMADEIFDLAEISGEEYKTSDILCSYLEKEVFVSIADLGDTILPDVSLTATPWLFQDLERKRPENIRRYFEIRRGQAFDRSRMRIDMVGRAP